MIDRPKIGVGVMVVHKGKILLGKRKNSHGNAHWAFPGGHLECGESIESCAQREVFEETNLVVTNITKITFTNDIFVESNKHYVTLFMRAEYHSGILENKEPEKCNGWYWFEPDSLPQPLFLPMHHLLQEISLSAYLAPTYKRYDRAYETGS